MTELNGVLPVDKPQGPTSHDIVAATRRALRTRRIGHTGTLDPFASGLLLLCVGPATRLAEYLTALPKTYHATLRLGEATDTDDLTGTVVRQSDAWRSLRESEVREALERQTGALLQMPPDYSAKKVDGTRAYAAARRGEKVELTAVEVTVYRMEIRRVELPEVEFEVECSSGTYIRAIARDAGEALGVGSHLTSLRRTRTGGFAVSDALTVEQLEDPAAVSDRILSPLAAVAHLPRVVLDAETEPGIANGGSVPAPEGTPAGEPIAIASADERLLAVGERRGDRIQPRKVFA